MMRVSLLLVFWVVEMGAMVSGAPVRHSGAPGDNQCVQCHLGTRVENSAQLRIRPENGGYYEPGVRQRIRVELVGAEGRVFGVQVTARLTRNPAVEAGGTLHALTEAQWVACDNDRERPATGGCPAGARVEFLNHAYPAARPDFAFDWTPPVEGGSVDVYVALNEITGSGLKGAKMHLRSLRMAPVGSSPGPRLVSGGVQQAGQFGGGRRVSAGTLVELYGENLAGVTESWGAGDFQGGVAPERLAGVAVRVGGKAAFVQYVSPGQVNAVMPDGVTPGMVEVEVRNPAGVSNGVMVEMAGESPGLLPVALRGEGGWVTMFALGLGETEPRVGAGQVTPGLARLKGVWRVLVEGREVEVNYGGLVPGLVGLYQVNWRPAEGMRGEVGVVVEVNGRRTQEGVVVGLGQ